MTGDEEEEAVQEEAVLEIPISFNPLITNSERVASVIDAILDNALSTFGIMDACGDPYVGVGAVSVSSPVVTEYDLERAIELRRQAERQCARMQKDRDYYKGIAEKLTKEVMAKIGEQNE